MFQKSDFEGEVGMGWPNLGLTWANLSSSWSKDVSWRRENGRNVGVKKAACNKIAAKTIFDEIWWILEAISEDFWNKCDEFFIWRLVATYTLLRTHGSPPLSTEFVEPTFCQFPSNALGAHDSFNLRFVKYFSRNTLFAQHTFCQILLSEHTIC